ncbi:putative membrane protein [Nosema bombycis CQ1]|nr:putative membrane protein [Nosema bombycis CQ1]|eukprot:EOB11154.1 putative membrane protein [Nosema bombycis CQ1]
MRMLFRFLDHISIFILISGTQTSVVLNLLPPSKYTKYLLTLTWSITIGGIAKIVLLRKLGHVFDLVLYILHGASVVPFFKILIDNLRLIDLGLFVIGGVVYIAGGIIFGIERPNPYPKVFGYHEIFHVFTIIANYCFFVPVLRNYLLSLKAQFGN